MTDRPDWYNFQEDICKYFISLGVEAKTNQSIKGVRTSHDIDVLVKTKYLGEEITWIIEAKDWKSNVPKEKVLALRTIVDDVGADRGYVISKIGFQSGAYEAAENSNVFLKTFEQLQEATEELIQEKILQAYKVRANIIDRKYWSHKKEIRKKYNLRGEMYEFRLYFSGTILLTKVHGAIRNGEKQKYPMHVDTQHEKKAGNDIINNFQQLRNWLDLNLNLLDSEILNAEYQMMINSDFNPDLERLNPSIKENKEMIELMYEQYAKMLVLDDE